MPTLNTPQPARHPQPTTKATALAYLIFERPDLTKARAFIEDFGLLPVTSSAADTLFFRSHDRAPFVYVLRKAPRPRFVGLGLAVGDKRDLEKLALLPNASPIEASPWPGGGDRVRLRDPSNFEVHAVCGQADASPLTYRKPLSNNRFSAPQRIDATQRPELRPPEILRLGHVALATADYQATLAWYCQHFGMIPSDVQVLDDGVPVVSFLRFDLGEHPADHHSIALAQGFAAEYNHSAYEVIDADAVAMGQRVLSKNRWKHAWGIGRHILGSQIFDYWNDPWGDKHEHYCDGDLFTSEHPVGIHPVSREAMSQWGPVMPTSFNRPQPSLRMISDLVRNLRRSPDVSLGKLLTLARIFT